MSMELRKEDIEKCESLVAVVDEIVSKLAPATEEQLELVKQEELPILTENATSVKKAAEESFIPLLKSLKQSLDSATVAYKTTIKAAGGAI